MQTLIPIYMMISLGFIMNIIVGAIGIYAWLELKSFMKSTHKVEFVPLDPKMESQKETLRDQDLNEYEL